MATWFSFRHTQMHSPFSKVSIWGGGLLSFLVFFRKLHLILHVFHTLFHFILFRFISLMGFCKQDNTHTHTHETEGLRALVIVCSSTHTRASKSKTRYGVKWQKWIQKRIVKVSLQEQLVVCYTHTHTFRILSIFSNSAEIISFSITYMQHRVIDKIYLLCVFVCIVLSFFLFFFILRAGRCLFLSFLFVSLLVFFVFANSVIFKLHWIWDHNEES